MTFPRPLAFGLVLALVAGPALAQQRVYQWKDANGVTHYSDTRPADRYTTRNINSATGSPAPTQAEEGPAESAQCKSVRLNLARLQGSGAVGVDTDGDGKPDRNLSTEERQSQRELNEAAVKAYCPPSQA